MRNSILLFLATLFFTTSIFAQAEIDRGPYLQLGTPSSMTIKWRTTDPAASVVRYGSAVDNLDQIIQSMDSVENHEIKLEGLNADTRYYYAVGDASGILTGNNDSTYFETNPPAGTAVPFTAWVQGDPGTGGNIQRATRDGFYTYMGGEPIDLMLVLGDNAYDDGKQSEYQKAFFENMYEDLIDKMVVWPTLGNHDAVSANSADESGPYYDIFTLPTNGEAGGYPSGTEAYYSFDYSNVHFVVLNSVDVDRSDSSAMAIWLEQDLQEVNSDWIVAYFHHPIYSGAHNNESDDGNEEMEMRMNFLPILEAYDVDLVLFGDTHNYQRSFLLKGHYGPSATFDTLTMAVDYGTGRLSDDTPYSKENGDGGAVFVVTGSAGKLEGEPAEDLQHPTTVLGMDELGSCALEVHGDQLDFKFILQDGTIADHFTIIKAINPLTVTITSPADSAYFPNLQNINITAEASDANGSVTSVAFYVDNELIETDLSAPYSTTWHPLHAGSYRIKAVATDNEGFTRTSAINIQVGQATTICSQVTQSSDDAEERPTGSVNLTSSDLEMVKDGNNEQVVGMRFTGYNIPHGAAIIDAYLTFQVKDDSNINPCQINISGQMGINTATFSSQQNNISSRPKTNNSVTWSPPDWEESGDIHSSPDIGAVIQEIVMQYNYTPDQAMVIILDGIGNRNAYSFDKGEEFAPQLCITYDADNCLDADFDGTCDIDDLCPDGSEQGQPCNDNNDQTFDDVVNNDCICQGTLYDCPELQLQYGTPCDDGNPGTYNDTITVNCNCMGILYDCPDLQLQFGTPCDDNYNGTYDDVITTDCECEGTLYDCPDLQLEFGTPCDDNYAGTYDDVITSDCECEGTLYDCPDLALPFGAPCDDNNPLTCYDIVNEDCECIGIPTTSSATAVSSISTNNDDAEEKESGNVSLGSSDLELIMDGSNDQVVGLRFLNPGIAADTDISNAIIRFTVDESKNTNPCNLVIYGELSTNALPFANTENNISNRVKTTASVNWSPNDWVNVGESGPDQETVDLSPIIQELQSQAGFTESSPFVFIIEGEGKRVAISHDKRPSDAAKLTITYTLSLGDSDGDGICDDEDQCVGLDPGSPCDDSDPTTYNDVINNNCACQGTPYDCPDLGVNYGATCDDGNPGTYNDVVNNNCECEGTLYDCPELGVNYGTACDDGNPGTYNDYVNNNCECVGSLFECPDLGGNIGDPCDDGDPLSSDDEIDANCDCVGEPPVEVLICDRINRSSDDAEERSNGSVNFTSSDLELTEDNGNTQIIGLRWTGLELDQNAVINQAYIQFTVDKDNNIDPCILTIHGELSTNASTFAKTENNISDRNMTNASVSWTPPEWEENEDSGPAQQTPDISTIIQEIISQEDFGPESPIVLIISGEGLRQAISFDEDEDTAAELCVSTLVPPGSAMATHSTTINNQNRNALTTIDEEVPSSAAVKDATTTVLPSLKLFPNPAKSSITLRYHSHTAGELTMSILDAKGKKLWDQQVLLSEPGMNQQEIDTANLPNGIYFLTLQSEKTRQIAKFSIIK